MFIGLLGTIPQIIIVIAVSMYAAKRSSAEAVLMMIGAITGLLSSIFYTVALPWVINTYGITWYQSYSILISAVAMLGGLCFAVGLLLLVQNILNTKS